MYIAMNRYKIKNGNEKDFEKLWRNRETFLDKVEGFKRFNLIKGDKFDEYTLYASHRTWSSKNSFINWTKSEEFRNTHKNAGENRDLYLGHLQFEGFEAIL